MLPLSFDLPLNHLLLLGVVDRLEEVRSGLVHVLDASGTQSFEKRENGLAVLDALGCVDHGNRSALAVIRFEQA